MVRENVEKYVGQRVVVEWNVSVPWDGKRVGWCVENGVVRRGGEEWDHSWIQWKDNEWCTEKVGQNVKRGDKVVVRGVVGKYTKKGGIVDYNIQDIDIVTVNGKGWKRGV